MGNKTAKPVYKDKALMSIEEQVTDIWKRPLYGLATHKDLGRLISSITIIHEGKSIVFEQPQVDVAVKAFLTTLWDIFDPNDSNLDLKKSQLEEYQFEQDTTNALRNVFRDILKYEGNTTNILKAINQSVIAPPIVEMKLTEFGFRYPLMDLKGEWKIVIKIDEVVTVTHTRGQRYKNEENSDLDFDIFWKLEFQYDSQAKELENVVFAVEYLTFHNRETLQKVHFPVVKLLAEFGYPQKQVRWRTES